MIATDETGISFPGLSVDLVAGLSAAIGENTRALRDAARQRQRLFEDVAYIDDVAFATGAFPYAPPGDQFGPNVGYWWAVQRITMAGFGATTDFINLYRSSAGAITVPNKALFTFQEAVAGGVATWHPGRTGLLLNGKSAASLAVNGTFTGAVLTVNCDVIQVTDAQLAAFLL